MGKQFYIGIDIVAAPFDEFMEIAEAELEGRLMVFHLKKKWWDLIMNGIKDREYRGDKWDKYIEPFMYMDIQGIKLYVELDLGYPKKGDFSRKKFFSCITNNKGGKQKRDWRGWFYKMGNLFWKPNFVITKTE